MAVIGFILGIAIPRLTALYLYFFTAWFTGVFETRLWPILGFLIMPRTMLWWSAVVNWYGGQWDFWQIAGLVAAIIIDIGGGKSTAERKPYGYF